jgi:AraC-like DNA-binding protein/uncharacterized protein (DUF3820 family)
MSTNYIKENLTKKLTLDEIAANVGLSKYYFLRQFKKITGYTVIDYVNIIRCEYAQELLRSEKYKVKEVALLCGFDNFSYFTNVYKKYTGKNLDNAHDAFADTIATLEVYKYQRNNNEEFIEEILPHFKYNMDISGNYMYRVNETTGAKEVYINFGKWKGTKIDDVDTKYLEWIAKNTEGFPIDTINLTKKILKMRGILI